MHHAASNLPEDLKSILKRLNAMIRKRREQAMAEARQLSSEQLLALASEVTRPIEGIRKRFLFGFVPFWVVLVAPASFVLVHLLHRWFSIDEVSVDGSIMSLAFGVPMLFMAWNLFLEKPYSCLALIGLIEERADSRLLGPALELLRWTEVSMTRPRNIRPSGKLNRRVNSPVP